MVLHPMDSTSSGANGLNKVRKFGDQMRTIKNEATDQLDLGIARAARWSHRLCRLPVLMGCLCAALLLQACSTGVNLIGVEATPPTERSDGRDDIEIFIATTRAPAEEESVFFSGLRGQKLSFAKVDVSIPPAHTAGQVGLPRNPPPDSNVHMVLRNPVMYTGDREFLDRVGAALRKRPPADRTILIFIHGYNTNMTEAVARFGQLVEDTGFRGVPVLFSWPSTRRTIDYVTDLNSAIISRDALVESAFLLNTLPVKSVDILAHSMGNFLMMEAARTLSLKGNFNRLNRLGSIVLASPDIDVELFTKQLGAIPPSQIDKFVVLLSQDDKALRLSSRIAGGLPRLGAADPKSLENLGIVVVDLTQINDTSTIQHSKFADSPEIVQLLGAQLGQSDTLSTSSSETDLFLQRAGNVISIIPGL